MPETIIILDYGSQYSQLIARRIRELQVYVALLPWDAPEESLNALNPRGFILSGGPQSVYEAGAPQLSRFVLDSGLPVLGICYGMQAMVLGLGGRVAPAVEGEYGLAALEVTRPNTLLTNSDNPQVWMSHGDRIEQLPQGFEATAKTDNSPVAAMADEGRRYYGLQFHPEVNHTQAGKAILSRFVLGVCACRRDWTPYSIISEAVAQIQAQVGKAKVLSAVSGGVDSSVATALVRRAIGGQLSAVYVDTGLMRQDEGLWVERAFRDHFGEQLIILNATKTFYDNLAGITAPEEKRRIIGETFIRLFESVAHDQGDPPYLVQGTIYPDVIESRAVERGHAQLIKTHHNVGGLPDNMSFKLVEPLRNLFKDEVRQLGVALGLPPALVRRQPFPGPGLAVRCIGLVTEERVERLRHADAIFTEEMAQAELLGLAEEISQPESVSAQAFAVLLPVKAVGVMGDKRTYEEVIALRAVSTDDFMTADWTRLPFDLLSRVSSRIVNEVAGVNRVVYDITSKPPGTIEWE